MSNIIANVKKKVDGWVNLLAGLSGKSDKTKYTTFGEYEYLEDQMLGRLYMGEGLATKIIKTPADDMTRKWITIANDDKGEIQKTLDDLKAEERFNEAIQWQRLYGGAIIVMGIMDGKEADEPLNMKTAKSIEWLEVVDRSNIILDTSAYVQDTKSKDFGKMEIYDILIGPNLNQMRVHRSRVLEFFGNPAPKGIAEQLEDVKYWGMSILQTIFRNLASYGSAVQSIDNILYELIIGKYKIAGLSEKLASGNESQVIARMEMINMYKSVIHAVLLGENEDYIRDTVNAAGIPDLWDRYMIHLSGVAEIPVTKLFGRSPAGENATGEGDLNNYYDSIESKQKLDVRSPLQRAVDIIAEIDNIPGDNHQITFNPLKQMTKKEIAEIDKMNAETDNIYMQNGVVTNLEVREKRKGIYGIDE